MTNMIDINAIPLLAGSGLLSLLSNNWLEILGTSVGLVYLWLEYKASIYLWIASIIMPAIYVVVYYQAGLYADCGMDVYYLLAAIYGWLMWRYGSKKTGSDGSSAKGALPITHIPSTTYFPLAIVFLVAWGVIYYILENWTDSTVPILDSFTTAMSIIGMWVLAKKHVEQWLVWIIVDVVSCMLYCYKGLYFTSALYGLYTVIAVFGYRKWLRMMK